MCGISGIFGRSEPGSVEAMVKAMHHRGPDDAGIYRDGAVALGMARLAILDLSTAGHQPMTSDDGNVVVVYNGEMYNFRSERLALEAQGVTFRSHSDTEVVLRLYHRYGDAFLIRMRGMFAVAIYDKRPGPGRERLLLARDQLGIKPLLYSFRNGRLVFGSEVKALLAGEHVERSIDPEAVRMLLTYGSVVQPRTILKNVQMLLPGHRLVIQTGSQPRVEPYWRLGVDRVPEMKRLGYDELVDRVGDALQESVGLQMVSDVPLGAFLSGGVDSSLLVAMMSRLLDRPVRTFSVGYAAEGAHMDETDDAARIARFIGTDHTRVEVTGNDARDHILRLAAGLDQPSVDGANSYFVSMAARRGVTVAISGTGGDEWFAGYPWFIRMVLSAERARQRPWRMLAEQLIAGVVSSRTIDPLVGKRGGHYIERLRAHAGFVAEYTTAYRIFHVRDAAKLLAAPIRAAAGAGRASQADLAHVDELRHASPIRRVSALTMRGYTQNQLLRDIDAVSMAHSLEVRVPFLDPVLADLALSIPDSAKLGDPHHLSETGTYTETGAKRILVDIAEKQKLLPPGIGNQPKRGFGMPLAAWLRGPLREIFEDTVNAGTARRRGVFEPAAVEAIRKDFLAGHGDWTKPWLLMMTELWWRTVLEGSTK